jgi:ribosomal-protein-alanine N-acetyltransferase
MTVLRGTRVLVRLATPADAPAIAAYWRRNRARFARWDPVRPASFFTAPHWRGQAAAYRREARADRSLRMFVFDAARPERVIGVVNLSNFVRGAFQACHLGYSIDGGMEGRGLMSETLRLVIAHAFGPLGMHRLMANYRPENRRSARLLRRLGFRIEGRARAYLLIRGRWRDHVLTSLVSRHWKPARAAHRIRAPHRGAAR